MTDARTGEAEVMPPAAERVIARFRPHARRLFWPSVALIADAGAVGYLGGSFPARWENLAVYVLGALVAFVAFVLPLFSWLARRYVITTRRLVLRRGLGTRTSQDLLHSRGYDVTVRRSPIQRLVGSGDVLVNSGLEAPVTIVDVPRVRAVQEALDDLMEHSTTIVSVRRQEQSAAAATTRVVRR